jgi:hypothetical protein
MPSREAFIPLMLFKITASTWILFVGGPEVDPIEDTVFFSPANVPLVGNMIDPTAGWLGFVDLVQLHNRVVVVLRYWVAQYLVISLVYDCLAEFVIALRIIGVDVWPPVFSTGYEAWSLRRFSG